MISLVISSVPHPVGLWKREVLKTNDVEEDSYLDADEIIEHRYQPNRKRTTFADPDFRVGNAYQRTKLLYGPRAANAYAQIKPLHGRMREEIIRHIPEHRRVIRELRENGFPFGQACEIMRAMYPDHPTYCDLARLGYEIVYAAADADTWAYSDAMDAGQPEPFAPCESPREAWEKYEVAA